MSVKNRAIRFPQIQLLLLDLDRPHGADCAERKQSLMLKRSHETWLDSLMESATPHRIIRCGGFANHTTREFHSREFSNGGLDQYAIVGFSDSEAATIHDDPI